MAKILVLHGPNLNLLGMREPHLYGHQQLEGVNSHLQVCAQSLGHDLEIFQSNAEFELINLIQSSYQNIDFIIINPGSLGHTSIGIRDALLAVSCPFIEVHVSNVYAREPFRHHSYLSDIAIGVISGLGTYGYEAAIMAATRHYININPLTI